MFLFIQISLFSAFVVSSYAPIASALADKQPDKSHSELLAGLHPEDATEFYDDYGHPTTMVPSLDEMLQILEGKQANNSLKFAATADETQQLIEDVKSKVKTYEEDLKFLPLLEENDRRQRLDENLAAVQQILKTEIDSVEKLANIYRNLHDGYRNLSSGIRKDACVLEESDFNGLTDGECLSTSKVNVVSSEKVIGHQNMFEQREVRRCSWCEREWVQHEVAGKDCIRAYKYVTRGNCKIHYEISGLFNQNACQTIYVSDGKAVKTMTGHSVVGDTYGSTLTLYCKGQNQGVHSNPMVTVYAKKVVKSAC